MKFYKKTFSNGLRLITIPQKNATTATVLVLVKAGSKYEAKNINGISHFLEHMCFKGTKNKPRSIDILHELDSLGSQNNAFTWLEYTGYYAKAHHRHVDKLIEIISDIYLNSIFPEAEIEKEKGVIIEEMNMYEDLPSRKVLDVFFELLYGDTPAGRTTIGKKSVIKGVKRSDFLEYKKKHYVAKGTIVVVAGNFEKNKIEKMVNESFKHISTGKKHDKEKVVEVKQKGPAMAVHPKKTDQTHIILGFRAYKTSDERIPALQVLSTIVGQGMSSRMFQKLREEMGAAYYVRASVFDFSDHGFFEISAGVDKNRLPLIITEILKELKTLKNEMVSDTELKKAKEYLIGNMAMDLESTSEMAEFYGIQEAVKGKIESQSEVEKKIRAVSAGDVLKVAKDILNEKRLNLSIVGDVKNGAKIKSLLKI